MKKIGLAFGGGGAKGFAHIPILEVFDELGIKPYCITGTSIGAILGALYASGHTANDIAEMGGRSVARVLRMGKLKTPEEWTEIGEPWKPYRATAARILWHFYLNG